MTNDPSLLVAVSFMSLLSLPKKKMSMKPHWGVQDWSEAEAVGKLGSFGVGTSAELCKLQLS